MAQLNQAQIQAVITAGGIVTITDSNGHTYVYDDVADVPNDGVLAGYRTATASFDTDDLSANAVGLVGHLFTGTPGDGDVPVYNDSTDLWEFKTPTETLPAKVVVNDANTTLADGVNIAVGTTTGTKIGTATSQKIGFFNSTPVVKPTVTGSKGANAALTSLLTALANLGLIVDSSS